MTMTTTKKTGRPSKYSRALAEQICELIRSGKSERQICAMKGMPAIQTLWVWKEKYPEFLEQSARARADSADVYNDRRQKKADELYRIAESHLRNGESIPKGIVEAFKVSMQEDAREAANRDDSRFGDRKRVALTGADGGAVKIENNLVLDDVSLDDLKKVRALLYGKESTSADGN